MRIFFYGGTFDPPHLGHSNIVKYCLKHCDKFIIIPNKKSPDKLSSLVTDINHRLNMLSLLFDNSKISIDLFEIESNDINYTYLTIDYLKRKFNNCKLTMIIGNDQLANFTKWERYSQILNQVNIICFNRKINNSVDYTNDKIKFIESFQYDISSTNIRMSFNKSKKIVFEEMLDTKIIEYIKEHKLYES